MRKSIVILLVLCISLLYVFYIGNEMENKCKENPYSDIKCIWWRDNSHTLIGAIVMSIGICLIFILFDEKKSVNKENINQLEPKINE